MKLILLSVLFALAGLVYWWPKSVWSRLTDWRSPDTPEEFAKQMKYHHEALKKLEVALLDLAAKKSSEAEALREQLP